MLPAAYAGAKRSAGRSCCGPRSGRQPRSAAHALALPADSTTSTATPTRSSRTASTCGGSSPRSAAATTTCSSRRRRSSRSCSRGRSSADEIAAFRERHALGDEPAGRCTSGRLVRAKGIDVLLDAWRRLARATRRCVVDRRRPARRARSRRRRARASSAPLARAELPVAYAAAEFAVLPSIPTPRFVEPWGSSATRRCTRARPVVATSTPSARSRGGLVRDGETGLVVPARRSGRRSRAAIERLLDDAALRARLGRGRARGGGAVHLRRDGCGVRSGADPRARRRAR